MTTHQIVLAILYSIMNIPGIDLCHFGDLDLHARLCVSTSCHRLIAKIDFKCSSIAGEVNRNRSEHISLAIKGSTRVERLCFLDLQPIYNLQCTASGEWLAKVGKFCTTINSLAVENRNLLLTNYSCSRLRFAQRIVRHSGQLIVLNRKGFLPS